MLLPYLTVPIALPGDENKGNEDKTVPCRIQPANVIAYHRGYSWGTFIYLTTGQAFNLTITVEEYEGMVRGYWKEIEKQSSKSKLKILQ